MSSVPVAQVTEKNGEVSCSVDETNRVRALLGLKPLRINKPAQSSNTQTKTQPLAQVTEKDGEVSCSVEETNRVRALLGLKPLRTDQSPSDSATAVHHQPPSTAAKKEGEDLAARVARAKKQRALKKVLAGSTLGDIDETPSSNSASAWVERSRNLVPAAISEDEDDDEDKDQNYSSSDLSGMKLSEGMGDDMKEGDSVVLTLKDQAVLKRGVGMRVELQTEHDDMLEDIRLKASNSSSKEDQMDEHAGVLSHYDDEDEYGEQALTANSTNGRRKRKALTIGAGGLIAGAPPRIKKDNDNEDQAQVSSNGPLEVSFAVSSDFKQEEPKKPVKMKKRKKSKNKKNKKEKSRARVPMSMAEELELEQEQKVKEEKKDQDVVSDGEGELLVPVDAAKATNAKRGSNKRSRAEFFDSLNNDDDDLQEALSRARMQRAASRREQEKQAGGRGGGDAASFVLEQVTRAREAEAALAAANAHVKREVLTDTTDFAAAVQSRLAEENERVEAVAAAATLAAQVKQEKSDADMDVDNSKHTNEHDDDDEEEDVLGQEADVGKGIFGALALLRQRGELGITRVGGTASEVVIGRANDPQPIPDVRHGGPDDEYKFSFRLEHRDDQGRLMSQKEAFRSQSYKFHGIMPSRNKMEKRMRRIEQELSVAHGGVDGDTPLGSVAATRKQMQQKGQAHVVL